MGCWFSCTAPYISFGNPDDFTEEPVVVLYTPFHTSLVIKNVKRDLRIESTNKVN